MFRNAIRWFRSTFVSIPLIVLATVAAASCAWIIAWRAPRQTRQRVTEYCKRTWARFVLAVGFVRVAAHGLESIDPARDPSPDLARDSARPYIFCANHLSYLDAPLLIATLPVSVRFLAKKSLFAIPFLGWGMRLEGDIAIDRDNPRAAARSLSVAAGRVRAGTSLVIFPEGGRSLDGELQPFLSGAFRLAIEAQVPLIPIAIRGTREALRPGSLFLRGGPVNIALGAAIPTQGLAAKDQDALAARVERSIRNMLDENPN
jgi:1-acyl-sn-glycerol-3-phosphate acyltransferase